MLNIIDYSVSVICSLDRTKVCDSREVWLKFAIGSVTHTRLALYITNHNTTCYNLEILVLVYPHMTSTSCSSPSSRPTIYAQGIMGALVSGWWFWNSSSAWWAEKSEWILNLALGPSSGLQYQFVFVTIRMYRQYVMALYITASNISQQTARVPAKLKGTNRFYWLKAVVRTFFCALPRQLPPLSSARCSMVWIQWHLEVSQKPKLLYAKTRQAICHSLCWSSMTNLKIIQPISSVSLNLFSLDTCLVLY